MMARGVKKDKSKEYERAVYAIGRPNLNALSKEEQTAFYSTLLRLIVEWKQKQNGSLKQADKSST